jgi:hypothetical protein
MRKRLRRDGVVPIVEYKTIQGDHKKESAIERDILRWLNDGGRCYAFKVHSVGMFDSTTGNFRKSSPFAVNGISDVICVRDGRVMFLEIKRPGGKQSGDQIKFMKAVRSKGVLYEVLTSVDDAEELIERLFGV